MDTISHGFWSALLWRADLWWLAALFGILPDVIAQTPKVLYNFSKNRRLKGLLSEDLPGWMKTYTHYAFHLTHSLVLATAITGVTWMVFGIHWWMLAWHLHIAIDMWTHRKEEATPFLYPLSTFRFSGLHWSSKHFLALNFLLLAGATAILV